MIVFPEGRRIPESRKMGSGVPEASLREPRTPNSSPDL